MKSTKKMEPGHYVLVAIHPNGRPYEFPEWYRIIAVAKAGVYAKKIRSQHLVGPLTWVKTSQISRTSKERPKEQQVIS